MRHEPRNVPEDATELEKLVSDYLFKLESYRRAKRIYAEHDTSADAEPAEDLLEAERELREWIGGPFLEHAPSPEDGRKAPEIDL